jgi:GWxTD domain-containing protein
VNIGAAIAGILPGEYCLKTKILDPETKKILTKEASFQITGQIKKARRSVDMPYYEEIDYFVSPGEYKKFKSMSAAGKSLYLKRFWQVHNYQEFSKRFEYAKENYSEGSKLGAQTYRGRIYIKYGAPDEIERSFFETEESRPFEHWFYYCGYEFIFVDLRRTGEYVLVWSKTTDEESQPSLFKYLNNEKRTYIKAK